MGAQQSRTTGENDDAQTGQRSSSISGRLSASFPRLQKNRESSPATSMKGAAGQVRKTGDGRGENEPVTLSSAQDVSTEQFPFLSVACACGCVSAARSSSLAALARSSALSFF